MKKTRIAGLLPIMAILPTLAGAAEPVTQDITYAREVSRIIQDNCQGCHQPGQIGPMSFMSYEEVRPWAPLIALKVQQGEMPPYQYDAHVGVQELQDDWRLDQADIDTIVKWVETGAPLGNPADLPEPGEVPRDRRVASG
jgi:mono/diheme cytochrome c family protein